MYFHLGHTHLVLSGIESVMHLRAFCELIHKNIGKYRPNGESSMPLVWSAFEYMQRTQKVDNSFYTKQYFQFNFLHYGYFYGFLSSSDFFQNQLFRKILSGIPSECHIVWIQIRPNVLSGLIWVQTVCISYQQMTLGDKELRGNKIDAKN